MLVEVTGHITFLVVARLLVNATPLITDDIFVLFGEHYRNNYHLLSL